MFKLVATWTFVSLFACNIGCNKLLKKGMPGDGGVTTKEASQGAKSKGPKEAKPGNKEAPKAVDPDDQLEEKLQPYIECLNSLSSSVHDAESRYLMYIPKTGPTGKGEPSLYKLSEGAAAKCTENVAKGKTLPPSHPQLEQAGEAFAKAASQIDPIAAQLEKYYEDKDYRDDKWAKGKELHPQLMAGFEAFDKADSDLHSIVDGITKPLRQRVLAKIEKEEGKKFSYHRQHVLLAARELIEATVPSGQGSSIDFIPYSTALTEFQNAFSDLTAYGDSHKSENSNQSNYDSFVKAADDFQKMQKSLSRCLRDAPAKAKVANGKIDAKKVPPCRDVSPFAKMSGLARNGADALDFVLEKYNEFINTANRSQFH